MSRLRLTDLVAGLIALALLVGWLVWQLSPMDFARTLGSFSPEHLEHFAVVDSSDRRLGYRVLLVALVVLSLAGYFLWLQRRNAAAAASLWAAWGRVLRWLKTKGAPFWGLLLAGLYAWTLPKVGGVNFPEAFGIYHTPTALVYGAFVVASAGLLYLAAWVTRRQTERVRRIVLVVCAAYVLLLMVPGLVTRIPTFNMNWPMVTYLEASHGPMVLDAFKLAAGQQLFHDFTVYYGVLRGTLLAIYMRSFGTLDIGGIFRLMQIFQVLFCLAAVAAYFIWYRNRPILLLFALLLVLPWIHSNHAALLFTNHGAWRSLGLPVGVLVVLLLRHTAPPRAAAWLGFAAALLILNNPETGICLAIGYWVFLLARADRLRPAPIGVLVGLFLAGALAGFALFAILLAAGLGQLPAAADWALMFRYILQTSSGFAGRPYYFDPLALLILAHCAYCVVDAAIRRLSSPLSWRQAARAAIAATTLVWLAYYVNGPERWYLWTHQFLYAFLLATYLHPLLLRKKAPLARAAHYRAVLFCTVVGPAILSNNYQALYSVAQAARLQFAATAAEGVAVSGVWLKPKFAAYLTAKADYLSNAARGGSLVYLTGNAYFMHVMTGIDAKLPVIDPYFGSMEKKDYAPLVDSIRQRKPERILFDEPTAEFNWPKPQQQFFSRLEQSLAADYEYRRSEQGWRVLERRRQ